MKTLAIFLLASLVVSRAHAATYTGYGPWRFGMSRDEVVAVDDYGPYTPVQATGGLETQNGLFDGRKTMMSFVFGRNGLSKIQVWAYQGNDEKPAVAAFARVYRYLKRTHGAVEYPAEIKPAKFEASVLKALAAVPAKDAIRLQIAPTPMPSDLTIFCSFYRQPRFGYFVLLYFQTPD
jgi:hypothetical protein